jgi:hypothetical protein
MEDIVSTIRKNIASKHPHVRQMTADVYGSLLLDVWPSGPGVVDFGIDSTGHLGALQYAVRDQGVTPEQLDEALGNGSALTALIQPPTPYHGVKFETVWDKIGVKIIRWADVETSTKFPLGHVCAAPRALKTVPREQIIKAVRRHAAGDWGFLDAQEKAANDAALKNGGRLFSAYAVLDKKGHDTHLPPCWVQTELAAPVTFVLTYMDRARISVGMARVCEGR